MVLCVKIFYLMTIVETSWFKLCRRKEIISKVKEWDLEIQMRLFATNAKQNNYNYIYSLIFKNWKQKSIYSYSKTSYLTVQSIQITPHQQQACKRLATFQSVKYIW